MKVLNSKLNPVGNLDFNVYRSVSIKNILVNIEHRRLTLKTIYFYNNIYPSPYHNTYLITKGNILTPGACDATINAKKKTQFVCSPYHSNRRLIKAFSVVF